MVKVIIKQVLEFEEDFILEMINVDRDWDDLKPYESIEDVPEEELHIWFENSPELVRDTMEYSDFDVEKIITGEVEE